ncbi:MAG: ATP-binding protein [Nanoarchaeota archaeon]|nr:ATP-binding protein [Nanoarchaeota archaeon]
MKIVIPDSDDPFEQAVDCFKAIQSLDQNDKIDLSKVLWISPFVALMLSHKIEELRLKGHSLDIIKPESVKVQNYLQKIGFPLGSDYIKGNTAFPIKHFNSNPEKAIVDLYKYIESTFPVELRGNTINYILSELVDNVDQHSKYSTATVLAQYYPLKKYIDIGVVDNGYSIPGVFTDNGIDFVEDHNAIKLALEGVSTKNEEGRGKGLQSTSKLTTKELKGTLYAFSRNGAMVLTENVREAYKLQDTQLKGTLIYLRFAVPKTSVNLTPYY